MVHNSLKLSTYQINRAAIQSAFPAGPGVVHVASTSGLLEVPSPLQPPPPRHNNTDAMVVMPPARKFGAGGDSLQSAGMKLDDAFDKVSHAHLDPILSVVYQHVCLPGNHLGMALLHLHASSR